MLRVDEINLLRRRRRFFRGAIMVKLSVESVNIYGYRFFEQYLTTEFPKVLGKSQVMKAFWKWSAFQPTVITMLHLRPGTAPVISLHDEYPFGCQYDDMDPPNEPKPHLGRVKGMRFGMTTDRSGIRLFAGLAALTDSILIPHRKRQKTDQLILDMTEATILHEMIHWSHYVTDRDEEERHKGDIEKGTEAFEREAYGHLMSLDWHLMCYEEQKKDKAFLGAATELSPGNKLKVTAVLPYSPAGHAGLQVGDLIITMDGRKIASKADFDDILVNKNPFRKDSGEDTLLVEISRGAETKILTVKLATDPNAQASKRYGF